MIREILRMGDPRLLRVSEPVRDFGAPELRTLVDDMFETMHAANGAGLAAPQIGVPLRVVIFGYADPAMRNPRYPDADPVPQTILINPVLEPLTDEVEDGWEGCLSVPGLRGVVPRVTEAALRRLRPRRAADRAGRRGIPRARRAARVRPPRRHPVPDANAGSLAARLHRRPVPRTRGAGRRLG